MVAHPDMLSADRAIDQAWRCGVGVGHAATHAKRLNDLLREDPVVADAKTIVSERHECSPEESLVRLVFVAQRTNRPFRDIAHEVVASAAAERQSLAVHPPRLYRFTL